MTPAPIRIRVPGSTSNLGPGFDVLGMAVNRYLELRFEPSDGAFRVSRSGTLAGLDALSDEDDLVVREVDAVLGRRPSGRLHLHSTIPVGRGLGSSAAARAAGAALALCLRGTEVDRERLVARVARGEGHPDNAVPAVMGGLVAARLLASEDGDSTAAPDTGPAVEWRRYPVSEALAWVFAAPGTGLDTAASRRALPERVPLGDAVANAARIPLLLAALETGDGPALARNVEDRLHVPFRIPLIRGAEEARSAGREAGAWAVTLSGAGSGLLAIAPRDRAEAVRDAMARAFREADEPGSGRAGMAFLLRPDLDGIRIRPPGRP